MPKNEKKEIVKLTPETIDAMGKNEREAITHRVKTLMGAWESHKELNIADVAKLAADECANKGMIMFC